MKGLFFVKKVIIFTSCVLACILIIVITMILINHNIAYAEVYTFKKDDLKISEDLPDWFAIRDDDFANDIIDDKSLLSTAGLDSIYDSLDLKNYTYIVLNGYKLNSLQYSIYNCSIRNSIGFPVEYIGKVSAQTDNEYIHIYRIKHMNIQYDYHNGNKNIN